MQSFFSIAAIICVLQGNAPICFAINFTNEGAMSFAECSSKIDVYTANIFGQEGFRDLPLTSFQVWCYPVTMAGITH